MNKLVIGLGLVAVALAGCGDDEGGRRPGAGGGGDGGGGTGSAGSGADDGSGDAGDDGGSGAGSGGTGTSGGDGGGSGDDGSSSDSGGVGTGETTSGDAGSTGGGSTTGDGGSTTGDGGSATDGGSTSDGGGATGTATRTPCQEETANVEPVPPRIMFVLDKSGSMTTTWGGGGSRWASLHAVVDGVLATFEAQIEFGLKLYPKAGISCGLFGCTGACDVDPVEVGVALNNRANIIATMPGAGAGVDGETPIETGLRLSTEYLQTLDPAIPRAQILVADGQISTSCSGEVFADALQIVTDAWNMDGISTYVVGIDVSGAGTDGELTQLANAGGKPKPGGGKPYYETTNQAELDQAMQDIVGDTLGCVIDIAPEPLDPSLFEVWIGGSMVPEVGDCATEDGWVWTNQYDQIELCGTACDDLVAVGSVDTKYFCEPG